MDSISSPTLTFGDAASGAVTVNGAMSRASGTLNIIGSSITVGAGASVSNASGNVSMTADSMAFGGGAGSVSAAGTITLQQKNSSTPIDIGGADGVGTATLGLNATDIAALSGGAVQIGNSSTPTINVTTAISNFGAMPVTLVTTDWGHDRRRFGRRRDHHRQSFSLFGYLHARGHLSGGNVTLNVLDSSRSVDLGTASSPSPGSFLLDNTELSQILTPGTFTLSAGTINAPSAVSFIGCVQRCP